jgi:two-component system LytT family response regulator
MKLEKANNGARNNTQMRILSIKTIKGYELIGYESILYLEADACYTTIYLSDNSKIIASKNIGYFEKRLDHDSFIRIHDSYIVSITKIKRYENSAITIIDNKKALPVSRTKKTNLLKALRKLC